MAWVAQLGSTLLIPTGGVYHLHIVCNDPMNFPGRVPASCLLVNLSSVVPKCDRTLVLRLGDHPFVNHDSFVFYAGATIDAASTLEAHVRNGVYAEHAPANRALVRQIVACMDVSDFTRGEFRKASTQVWNSTTW